MLCKLFCSLNKNLIYGGASTARLSPQLAELKMLLFINLKFSFKEYFHKLKKNCCEPMPNDKALILIKFFYG